MKIQKFEQSGFVFESESGFRIAFDIGNKTALEKLENLNIDAMFVSHVHGDHFSLEQIKKINPKVLYLNSECREVLGEESLPFEIKDLHNEETVSLLCGSISTFHVDHGPNVSVPLQDNFGFLIEFDGKQIYFAGDMYNPSGIDVSELSVDYALLPVGGHYTFGPEEAFEFAKTFKEIKTLVPVHYEKNDNIDPLRKDEFVELVKNDFNIEIM